MATQLQKELMKQVENIAEDAMEWVDNSVMSYAVPESERPTPWEIFGKDGENSLNYKRCFKDLLAEYVKWVASGVRVISSNTVLSGDVGIAANNILAPFSELLISCGNTPKDILDAFLKAKKKDEERNQSLSNPLNWNNFNKISANYQTNVVPVNVKQAFRRILQSKVTTEKRSHEYGDLDPDRFSQYYTGDVFTQQKENKPKLAVYIYADTSGSMTWQMNNENIEGDKIEDTRQWVANNILTAMFSALEEVASAGVRWQFAVWGQYGDITVKKALDKKIAKPLLANLYLSVLCNNATWIRPVLEDWKKIKPAAGEKVIIIVLTDGVFSEGKDVYNEVKNRLTPYVHIWIPICFDPTSLGIAEAENLFKGVRTLTEQDVNSEILRQFKKALDKLL